MNNPSVPPSVSDFLMDRVRGLPTAARLIMIFDPGGHLHLDSKLDLDGATWQVVRYDGNDLAFRRQYPESGRVLVWVTDSTGHSQTGLITINSLEDVWRRTDDLIDCSMVGVLQALVPSETWPLTALNEYEDIIGVRLNYFVEALDALRPFLGREAALDSHSINAMVLHCLQPSLQLKDFLFRLDSPARVVSQYTRMAWAAPWDERGQALLQRQAREASLLALREFKPWFEVPIGQLAPFLYLFRFLSRAHIPNIANQIRGLQLLGFDPEPLEPGLGIVLDQWTRNAEWRQQVIRDAETQLQDSDLRRVMTLLDLAGLQSIAEGIQLADTPALVYFLAARLLDLAAKSSTQAFGIWRASRPVALDLLKDGDTPYARSALALASLLDEMALIDAGVAVEPESTADLSGLVDWYVSNRLYDLEYAHARAVLAVNRLRDESIKTVSRRVLDDLRARLRAFLDRADHLLANRIMAGFNGYMTSPRLSINVLRNFVTSARLRPTADACLWFIVLDGMRYDTWMRVVRPRLMQTFQVKKERAFLGVLPSWTRIARTSLLAGRTPDAWRGTRKTFTFDQQSLFAAFFNLNDPQQVRFYSGMENDLTARQLNRNQRLPYNVLIFNISDDDLHKQREHVAALNENVKSALDRALDMLDGLIRPEDTVIISSDHGFMELDPDFAIPIRDDSRWQRLQEGGEHPVRFRYITGVDATQQIPEKYRQHVYQFEWRGVNEGTFTVPIGRWWFRREESRNAQRYAHGGLSFAELVVPGAVLQLVTKPIVEIAFESLPSRLTFMEEEEHRAIVKLQNKGNRAGEYELSYRVNPAEEYTTIHSSLDAGEIREIAVSIASLKPRAPSEKSQSIHLILSYITAQGSKQTVRREIPLDVQERKDIIKIEFGGLDDLDRL